MTSRPGFLLRRDVRPGLHRIDICYRTYGDPGGEPMLLMMGLAGPLIWWDPDLCTMLAERGYYVIRFDNRDVGSSSTLRRPRDPLDAVPGLRRPAGPRAVHADRHGGDASRCSTTSGSTAPTSSEPRWAA